MTSLGGSSNRDGVGADHFGDAEKLVGTVAASMDEGEVDLLAGASAPDLGPELTGLGDGCTMTRTDDPFLTMEVLYQLS